MKHRERLTGKALFAMTKDYCFDISLTGGVATRAELRSTQWEAAIRVFNHAEHATAQG